jgi:hypothetical protein
MEPQEKQEMLSALEGSHRALLTAVQDVTEEMAGRAPGPGRWSIRQCLEHVAVVEDYLLRQIETATPAESPMVNLRREAAIRERGADRTRPVLAPEPAQPMGRFSTMAEALDHFRETRSRTIRFVEACTLDLRSQITSHPMIGTVNCYETLLIMAVHPRRHAKQIAEIRAAVE